MNNMVSGIDVIFETLRQGFDIRRVLDAIIEIWPNAYFQHADEDDVCPLNNMTVDGRHNAMREFFVYKDQASAVSWNNDGWTEEHGNDMAHIIIEEDSNRPDVLQLTLVIGATMGDPLRVIAAISNALRTGRSRIEWESELRAAGYTGNSEQFCETVAELRRTLLPKWTAEELVCRPREALQFCEEVRRAVGPVPDHLVMKALMS